MEKKTAIIAGVTIAVVIAIVGIGAYYATLKRPAPPATPTVEITYTGCGPMPMLLATGKIDGYMAWQPFIAVAEEAKIGKLVSYSQDLPPKGKWKDHPCCCIFVRDDLVERNPQLIADFCALMTVADEYVREHPDEAAEVAADWLVGGGSMKYGEIIVSSVEVEKKSIPTIKFVTEPSDEWVKGNDLFLDVQRDLGYITERLKATGIEESHALLFNFTPYREAKEMLERGEIITPPVEEGTIGIGYQPSDHHTQLWIACDKWEYFRDNYSMYLKETKPKEEYEFVVNNKSVARIRLTRTTAGPDMMTLVAGNTLQIGLVGVPPAIITVDKGTPGKIIHPIHTEGSGLIVTKDAPCERGNWTSFIEWVKKRHEEGRPVKIATPLRGSIQDVQIKYALKESGIETVEV